MCCRTHSGFNLLVSFYIEEHDTTHGDACQCEMTLLWGTRYNKTLF